jgi:RimJ/RimL family protein N-acetyltransferase
MGKAYVDDLREPHVFKIEVGPFFYCAGEVASAGGQEFLKNLESYTLFMPSAPGWLEAGEAMYAERLAVTNRYSYSFESVTVEHLERLGQASSGKDEIKCMDLEFTKRLWGKDHFIDLSDYDSAEDFVQRGLGYYVEKSGEVIGGIFSSLVCSMGMEVSLFVLENYRRQGIATSLGCAFLKWCLENNMQAHWDAANLESCRLAEKLGYSPIGEYKAYWLLK